MIEVYLQAQMMTVSKPKIS